MLCFVNTFQTVHPNELKAIAAETYDVFELNANFDESCAGLMLLFFPLKNENII